MSSSHDNHDTHGHGHGHANQSRFIQHHFNDAAHQFDSGKFGIWLFLVQEILFFSALFVAYIIYRHQHPEIFLYGSHYLDTTMGAIFAGSRRPQQARIDVMLALGAGMGVAEIRELLEAR